MNEYISNNDKRMPIKRRVLIAVLLTTLLILIFAIITSSVLMLHLLHDGESVLSEQLKKNLSNVVYDRAATSSARFTQYEKYIEFFRDYTEDMYKDRSELIKTGKYFSTSRLSTGKDVYAMQSGFADKNAREEDYMDDILFFSHLEPALSPIIKNNEDQLSTMYLGTTDGLLVSYDKYSYLSAVPEPELMIYDYTQSEWFQTGLESDDVFYTSLYTDSQGRGLTVTIAAPFHDTKGNVRGVVAADFDITSIYEEMVSMNLGEGSDSFAIDPSGDVISIYSDEEVSVADYTGLGEKNIKSLVSGGTGLLEKDDAFYAYTPVEGANWILCAKVPRSLLLERVDIIRASFRNAMIVFVLIAVILILIGIYMSRRVTSSIIHPIELLVDDMQVIAGGNLNYKATAYRNDEIGDMTRQMNTMVAKLRNTMDELVNTQDMAAKMQELANKDALTGVHNRTSYNNHVKQLVMALADGETGFGFVAVDLNDLKIINDSYGHECGNVALRKLCSVLCDVFAHSAVFRIGGDEFTVIVKNRDYDHCDELVDEFLSRLDAISSDESLEPWERVSAAVGYALYDESIDKTIEDVSNRADAAMYENKIAMKAGRDYH